MNQEEEYKEAISHLLENIHDVHFLRQVWTILKLHVKRKVMLNKYEL